MASKDSKVMTESDKMEVDDDPVFKDSNEKLNANLSADDSEANQPVSVQVEKSNLVSKEKFNSLTSRLQLLEKRLKGPTEENDAQEIAAAEAPQSLNLLKAFNLKDSDIQKNEKSKKSSKKNISDDNSQHEVKGDVNSKGGEEEKKDHTKEKSDHVKNDDPDRVNCEKDEIVQDEKMEVDDVKLEGDVKLESDESSVTTASVKESQKSDTKEDIICNEQKASAADEKTGMKHDDEGENGSDDTECVKDSKEACEMKVKTEGDSTDALKDEEKYKSEDEKSTVKLPNVDSASQDVEIKEEERCSETVDENSTDDKATKKGSIKEETASSTDGDTIDKCIEDTDQANKNDVKDSKDAIASKKGRGIDAIASMLRKHQVKTDVKSESNDENNKKSSDDKESSSKSEIQGYFADTMNEFLGMYGYDNENQKEQPVPESNLETNTESETPKAPIPPPENKDKSAINAKRLKTCEECKEVKVCKYQVMMQGAEKFIRTHICDDKCYTTFREKQKQQRNSTKRVTRSNTKEICNICSKDIKNSAGYIPSYGENKLVLCSESCYKKFKQLQGPKRKCAQCKKSIEGRNKCLTWETMEFCTEDCLSNYQNYLGSHCACCNSAVQNTSLGKFCVRFGSDIKQFCSNTCLEEFKKGLKVCTYCQKDISDGNDGFLAPVGDKCQFKDFCSQHCMEKYDAMNNPNGASPKMNHCAVCHKLKAIKIEVDYEDTNYEICGELCYTAFKYTHKVKKHKCDHCHKLFEISGAEDQIQYTAQIDGIGKRFCSKMCSNIFVLSNRKIVPCSWCKVKKYNFDMIERVEGTNQIQLFCSLNCLSLFKVGLTASSSRTVKCDFCAKTAAAQYHLTMSDATVRNFCCYTCVAKFQNQYPSGNFQKVSATNQLNVTKGTSIAHTKSFSPASSSIISIAPPTVSRVQTTSINRQGTATSIKTVTTPSFTKTPITRPVSSPRTPSTGIAPQAVIVKPPQPKMLKNKGTMCKPIMVTKGLSCRPIPSAKESQSDEKSDEKIKYIPIPLPIYVPMPMHMYSMPTPVVLPIPIPIPVPVFIPTTKDSTEGIITSIKEIKEKADALSNTNKVLRSKRQKKESTANHNSEDENCPSSNDEADESESQDELVEENGETCRSPVNRVKGSLKRTASNGSHKVLNKRQKIALGKETHVKLHKTTSNHETPLPKSQSSSIDLSGNLKYMYGVSAWKNWVINKNQQLEKASQSNRKLKLFKTDILQLTPDELNYSLCLFVKEVRNPSGGEYDADKIYYLCLGIQQYLFLNNRLDNILTDANFEKFTECLNDALSMYETKEQVAAGKFTARVNPEILWESRQLGAHSPHVLLNTLLYFNAKYFGLKSVEDHMKMSFSQVVKTWKKSGKSNPSCLKYHPTNPPAQPLRGQKRKKEILEQTENMDNPLRCPVKLYEFYLSKCPEAIKSRSDVYYLYPERSCVPDSPVWYSMQPLGKDQLNKMLQRAKMIKGTFNHV